MKRKSNKFKAAACMLAGCIVLTGAVFANIDNASGYSNYKNALKKFVKLDNYTATISMSAYLDEYEVAQLNLEAKVGNGSISTSQSEKSAPYDDYKAGLTDGGYQNATYKDKNFDARIYGYPNDRRNIDVTVDFSDEYEDDSVYSPLFGGEMDEKLMDKTIQFLEVATDGFIGNIKNNFVYFGEEDGEKHYNVTLSKEQMPSIVTSGLSLMCGVISTEYNEYTINGEPAANQDFDYNDADDIMEMMFINEKEPYIKSASCDFKIDENGNLTHNTLSGSIAGYTLDGEEHSVGIKIEIGIKDIRTTVADSYDVYGVFDAVEMLDGTTKTVEELIKSSRRVSAINGEDVIYLYNRTINNYDSSADIYILNGKEVSNSEYNQAQNDIYNVSEETLKDIEVSYDEENDVVSYHEYKDDEASVGIIGGADGPTAVYISNGDSADSESAEVTSEETEEVSSESNDTDDTETSDDAEAND